MELIFYFGGVTYMLQVGIIGIGNAGNQVATLAANELKVPVIAINSSEKDLETVPDGITKKLISDAEGKSKGAGKDRRLAKSYLKDSIMALITADDVTEFLKKLDFLFVVSSTGGGTGSGVSPLLTSIINQAFPDLHTILIGILPVENEALDAHVNTLEYLNELYSEMPSQTYMLYDNDKFSGDSAYHILNKVNDEIVKDIDVLRCTYNYTTKYDSIDDRDMTRLISEPGRILVTRLDSFKDKECDNKTIEEMIIDQMKHSAHVETQRDKKVSLSGIIVSLTQPLMEEFNDNLVEVVKFVGEPNHGYKHIHLNDDRKADNFAYHIISGLTPINDKIRRISDRVEDIRSVQNKEIEESALDELNLSELTDSIADKVSENNATQVDMSAIFSKFGI
jgi:cell division GTPase FtsZ